MILKWINEAIIFHLDHFIYQDFFKHSDFLMILSLFRVVAFSTLALFCGVNYLLSDFTITGLFL